MRDAMKKSQRASIDSKKKSFFELSVSLIFSLWCLVFLFYTRLGHSHGNRDSYTDERNNTHSSGILLESGCYLEDQSSNLNTVGVVSPRPEAASPEKNENVQTHSAVDPPAKVVDILNGQRLDTKSTKNDGSVSNLPDPVKELRQQTKGRVPSDIILMILMQKVRSLELNFPMLEGYVEEVKQRYGNVLPNLERELSRNSLLLEVTKSEIKNVMEWKGGCGM